MVYAQTTVKLFVSLRRDPIVRHPHGDREIARPLRLTRRRVNTPVVALRFTPVGAETKPNVRVLVGLSASLAVLVTVSVASSLTV